MQPPLADAATIRCGCCKGIAAGRRAGAIAEHGRITGGRAIDDPLFIIGHVARSSRQTCRVPLVIVAKGCPAFADREAVAGGLRVDVTQPWPLVCFDAERSALSSRPNHRPPAGAGGYERRCGLRTAIGKLYPARLRLDNTVDGETRRWSGRADADVAIVGNAELFSSISPESHRIDNTRG